MRPLFFVALFAAVINLVNAQVTADQTFPVVVTFQSSPNAVTLSWDAVSTATGTSVSRKAKTDSVWGTPKFLSSNTTTYTDTTVKEGQAYEYKLLINNWVDKYQYLYVGNKIPSVHYRGKLLLVIDSTYTLPLAKEISGLISDLIGDGWGVIRMDVARVDWRNSNYAAAVVGLKNKIKAEYNKDPENVNTLFILGRVPVPHSGNLYPDGHEDHEGAWAADGYYGDIDGVYTDNSVNNTVAADDRNHNTSGDGKFDQSTFPGTINLNVGRVDLVDMGAGYASDVELIKQYLAKDHAYRFAINRPAKRAIVDDNFGYRNGAAFAASGWRNFYGMMHPDSVKAADFLSSGEARSYLWGYGCGGGGWWAADGIGATADMPNYSGKIVFSMLFGSYFGDWATEWYNFLRAPLATPGWILTSAWAGMPHYYYHHMTLGEPIGYSTRVSQNNKGLYLTGRSPNTVNIALMGDPTLRQDIVPPPHSLSLSQPSGKNQVVLNWKKSALSYSQHSGFHIYRAKSFSDPFQLINEVPVLDSVYIDTSYQAQKNVYMVRAVALETVVTGSYYNLSQGVIDSITATRTVSIVNKIAGSNLEFAARMVGQKLFLKFDKGISGPTEINLINVSGKKIFSETVSPDRVNASNSVGVEIPNLQAGLYWARVSNRDGKYSQSKRVQMLGAR